MSLFRIFHPHPGAGWTRLAHALRESLEDSMKEKDRALRAALEGEGEEGVALLAGRHTDPHHFLGPHGLRIGAKEGVLVRAYWPGASAVSCLWQGRKGQPMENLQGGLFALWLAEEKPSLAYRLLVTIEGGASIEVQDPYRFPPSLGELDLYLLGEGQHLRLWECLGGRARQMLGVQGFSFAVWAPNAAGVSWVGEHCDWDGRRYPMRRLGGTGVFEIFLPALEVGELYKFEILWPDGSRHLKADPVAFTAELRPGTASRTFTSSFEWRDERWLIERRKKDVLRQPMSIYEVHLGSWRRAGSSGLPSSHPEPPDAEPSDQAFLTYRELAPLLVEHVQRLGFNYLELLPITEHPFDGSWGYQITGFYAPTSRFGDPDDLRFFIDYCHRHGVGVILDWVPGHFVKDAHGLGRFDGSALYEHSDPRRGEHPDWGTYIFNLSRFEVRNFLLANALFWLEEFHLDGLRVDAVASMLYLDYSREEGQWLPNENGGRENLEAIDFLRRFNELVKEEHPGCFTVAEESTAWPGVTKAVGEGGLGFDLKWNMGWMHDTLSYFAVDPLFRSGCQEKLTFAMVYEHSEAFLNPLSHDEVVHGKGSLLNKMHGDPWRKRANLRALLAYQFTRPGKQLLFMGSELAPLREWNADIELDWYLQEDPERQGFFEYVSALGCLYRQEASLWAGDPDPESFAWISCEDRERSIFSYLRRGANEHMVVVLNLTPVPRDAVRIGVPGAGVYDLLISTDESRFGGSGYSVIPPTNEDAAKNDPSPRLESTAVAVDGYGYSLIVNLPPLAALLFKPAPSSSADSVNCLT